MKLSVPTFFSAMSMLMNIYDGLQDGEKRREPKTTKCIFGTMRKRPLRVLRPCYTSKPFPVLSASSHHRCRLGRARTSCPNRTHSRPAVLDVVSAFDSKVTSATFRAEELHVNGKNTPCPTSRAKPARNSLANYNHMSQNTS